MDIGKKIKTLRLAKGATQEILAQEVGVTPQAVSRWENGAAMPDITLLPVLSVYFGVRIDDFFELTDEAQLERIYSMTETEDFILRGDFDHAERFLKDKVAAEPKNVPCLHALAKLYNHRADGYHRKAEALCKRALEAAPTEKTGHSLLSYAANGACFDWCSCNHRELIDYYYGFVEKNPDFRPGYMWLLDNLIADLRLEEACAVIRRIDVVRHDYYPTMMEGFVVGLLGDREKAEELFRKALEEEPENWYAWSLLGDIRVKQCRFDEAVACFRKASELDTEAQYTDNEISIAYLYEMQGKWSEAADYYERALALYRRNMGLAEGFGVDEFERAILRCRAKA